MADLGNILKRAGGTALTGHPVKFTLVEVKPDGSEFSHEVEAMLFPVSIEKSASAEREAVDYQKELGTLVGLKEEFNLRFLACALRDPEEPHKNFVLAKDLYLLRKGLVQEQLKVLVDSYNDMLRSHYPEVLTAEDFDRMKADAKNFTEDGQTESGPSSP